jgi:hypothetical protein
MGKVNALDWNFFWRKQRLCRKVNKIEYDAKYKIYIMMLKNDIGIIYKL